MVPGEKASSYCFSGWHLRGGFAASWLAKAAYDPLRGSTSCGCRWACGMFGLSDPPVGKGESSLLKPSVCPTVLLECLWRGNQSLQTLQLNRELGFKRHCLWILWQLQSERSIDSSLCPLGSQTDTQNMSWFWVLLGVVPMFIPSSAMICSPCTMGLRMTTALLNYHTG